MNDLKLCVHCGQPRKLMGTARARWRCLPCERSRRVMPPCRVEGCNVRSFASGYCGKHYGRYLRHGDPLAGRAFDDQSFERSLDGICTQPGCHKAVSVRGLCATHLTRFKVHGDPNIKKARYPCAVCGTRTWGFTEDTMHDSCRTGLKTCKTCGVEKSANEFAPHKKSYDGRLWVCKDCKTAASGDVAFRARYGLTKEQVVAKAEAQGNRCMSCQGVGRLFVDHNHTTNVVRDMLCPRCNTLAGFIEKKPESLALVLAYLSRHGVDIATA